MEAREKSRSLMQPWLADAGSKAQTYHGPAAIEAFVDKDRTRYNLTDIANRAAAKSLPGQERRLND
jgi:hypothetical protein